MKIAPGPVSHRLVTSAEMRLLDRAAIEGDGVPSLMLMEAAGRAVVDVVKHLDHPGAVAVVCGGGNNGGDGLVVARHLHRAGRPVRVVLAAARDRLTADAGAQLDAAEAAGLDVAHCLAPGDLPVLDEALAGATVIVDALFGTGLSRPIEGLLAEIVVRLNESSAIRVAIDVPSGIDADDGTERPTVVRADHTVALAFAKRGLLVTPACRDVGTLHVVDIGIPDRLAHAHGITAEWLDPSCLSPLRAARPFDAHKGTYGHLLVVAGSPGKTGAAQLAGRGALRSGVGLCTVATPRAAFAALDGRVPELMTEPLDRGTDLGPLVAGKRAVVVGPGLPTGTAGEEILSEALVATLRERVPLVLDAEALNQIAGRDFLWRKTHSAPVVMTPHPGEAGRLLGLPPAEINARRLAAAGELARRYDATVVLKGARTIIADAQGRIAVNTTGTPAMATAGAGDVLAGVIGSLLAQGHDAWRATTLAVCLHGLAGELTERQWGNGLVAGDIADSIGRWLARG